jgi:hypothetical protein
MHAWIKPWISTVSNLKKRKGHFMFHKMPLFEIKNADVNAGPFP